MQPFAPVASAVAFANAASVTTPSITTQSGDLLVAVVVAYTNVIGATPITDSKGNTWVQAVGSTGTTNGFVAIFYAENCTGGAAHTFTFTPTGSTYITLALLDIGGAALTASLNQSGGAVANSTTHTSPSITSGEVPEVFIGAGAVSAAVEGIPVLPAVWWPVAAIGGSTTEGMALSFRYVGAGVTAAFSYTTASARNEGVVIAGFMSAAAAPDTQGTWGMF